MTEKSAAGGADKDLFGDPWTPPRDPRGRKSHKRTAQVAEKVAVLRGTGATEEEIAARIGLSVPTLTKYYFRELKQGPALAQAMLDEVMYGKAMAGNVSAAKYMKDRFSQGDASLAGARLRERALNPTAPAAQPPATKPGKKEERQADANRVAGENGRFAPPPAPTLVVNNRR